ncbi:hypothetical protein L6164_034468 [Bauhinia variegata]|uniref:Uncharacterized protein n=1 Tax=Bauhinia variegata TaxID=167791 RepID=A0ACB9KV02_BAUVA|nr:hypothetical protein L6164_034468 [Bauhinia variegata]
MKQTRRRQRILILSLLSVSVLAPLIFVSHRLKILTLVGRGEFIEDLASTTYRRDTLKLNAIGQEDAEGLEEPKQVVYKDKDFLEAISYSSKKNNDSEESRIAGRISNLLERSGFGLDQRENRQIQEKEASSVAGEKFQKKFNQTIDDTVQLESNKTTAENLKGTKNEQSDKKAAHHHHSLRSQSLKVSNERIKEIEDQVIRARVYLSFAPPNSNSHLVKELKLRIKELERAVGEATKDSELSRSALQKMRHMEASLLKAGRVYPNCSAMAAKLRAMTHNAEEQVRSQRNEVTYLVHLAARTTPKGIHCLSMRLTAEYFALRPEERKLPNEKKIHDPKLYHYAVFSDNILACAVVVNSTVSTAMEPKKLVLHVVTDSLNFPAISMWFLLNPPGKATIHIQSTENFKGLSKYSRLKKQNSSDTRYTSELNHLRFYLADVFPMLNKIVLFDHDVVIQRDLSGLWNANMKGKVIGAVSTCQEGGASFRRMDMFINFSDPFMAERFDANACTWAFGMNLFNLQEWRRQNLTDVYHKYLQLGSERPLWSAGTLPLGWVTFYNKMKVLDRRWHVLGLGYNSDINRTEIERAAVIHYDGVRKPWLDIAVGRYKGYWTKFVNYDHLFLQQCNLRE